jgi:hypothetical protein
LGIGQDYCAGWQSNTRFARTAVQQTVQRAIEVTRPYLDVMTCASILIAQ